jgi:hypothetical protein
MTGAEVPADDTELPEDAIDQKAEDEAKAMAARSAWENRRTKPRAGAGAGELAPNMQGCLLLQSLAQLQIANEVILQRSVIIIITTPNDVFLFVAGVYLSGQC